jgi:hypothetical protein
MNARMNKIRVLASDTQSMVDLLYGLIVAGNLTEAHDVLRLMGKEIAAIENIAGKQ